MVSLSVRNMGMVGGALKQNFIYLAGGATWLGGVAGGGLARRAVSQERRGGGQSYL